MLTKAQLQAALDASDDRRERLAYENATLRSNLESLHKRIRGLAVDLGAVQTEDAVEDVRRAVERLRLLAVEARAGRKLLSKNGWFRNPGPVAQSFYRAARAAAGE